MAKGMLLVIFSRVRIDKLKPAISTAHCQMANGTVKCERVRSVFWAFSGLRIDKMKFASVIQVFSGLPIDKMKRGKLSRAWSEGSEGSRLKDN